MTNRNGYPGPQSPWRQARQPWQAELQLVEG